MSDLKNTIVGEAIKPMSGFIELSLEPILEKFNGWCLKNKLEAKSDPKILNKALEQYLLDLAERVNTTSSIAFPTLKLDLKGLYIPLDLSHDGIPYKFEWIEEMSHVITLIVASAGSGKSTFSKYLVSKQIFKNPQIPILLELRNINFEAGFYDNLAGQLDSRENLFYRPLFDKLIDAGMFFIVLDGFDEVPVVDQTVLAKEIHDFSLKNRGNTLVVTTRPQYLLPAITASGNFFLGRFGQAQAESLIRNYDSIAGKTVGEQLISKLNNIPKTLLSTPLFISLVYKTYGVSGNIPTRISMFYDAVYTTLYHGQDISNKEGFERDKLCELDIYNFRVLLRGFCYLMAVNQIVSFESQIGAIELAEKAIRLTTIAPKSGKSFVDDLLDTVPLMVQSDKNSDIRFISKTILEYFSAEYIVFHSRSFELLDKIHNSKLSKSFEKQLDFIFDINEKLYDSQITQNLIKKFIQNSIPEGIRSRLLFSFLCQYRCEIGLYKSKSNVDLGKSSQAFISHKEMDHSFEYNDSMYRFKISIKEAYEGLHSLAWNTITSETDLKDFSCDQSDLSDAINYFIEKIGLNKLVTFDFEMINYFESNVVIVDMILGYLINSNQAHKSSKNHIRIISKSLCSSKLDAIERAVDIDDEAKSLLF